MTENAALFMISLAFLRDTAGFGIMAAFLVLQKLFQKKMAGETSCYMLLAFICLRMELHWRSTALGKIRLNFVIFQDFTQSDWHHLNLLLT